MDDKLWRCRKAWCIVHPCMPLQILIKKELKNCGEVITCNEQDPGMSNIKS